MSYIKLVKARDTELAEDIVDYDGEDTELLDMYVAADDGCDMVYKDKLGKVEVEEVEVVVVIGESFGGVRCYTNKVEAYRDAAGDLWLAERMYEEVFC
jgi:hypothetical protein